MLKLARKISRAKWDQSPDLRRNEISADAVTADLRTFDNKLSFWKCTSQKSEEVDEVFVALAAERDRIDRIDIVLVPHRLFDKDGISIEDSPGKTPVAKLQNRHVDASRLDLTRLGKISRWVAQSVQQGGHIRKSKGQVTELLRKAVENGSLDPEKLRPKVKSALNK